MVYFITFKWKLEFTHSKFPLGNSLERNFSKVYLTFNECCNFAREILQKLLSLPESM